MKKHLVSVLLVVAMLMSACGVSPSGLNPDRVPPAPNQTAAPLKVLETPSGSGVKFEPTPQPVPMPPGVTIVHISMEGDTDFERYLLELEQYSTKDGNVEEAVFLGLLGEVINGLSESLCGRLGDNAAVHLLEKSQGVEAFRLQRLSGGGFKGFQAFVDALKYGTVEVRAIVASYTKGQALFLLKSAGKDILLILSKNGPSTVIPMATTAAALELIAKHIVVQGGRVTQGVVIGATDIGPMLGVGIYTLTGVYIAATLKNLALFASCLEQKMSQKSAQYREWLDKGKKPQATDQAAQFAYASQADLMADITLLESLGIAHQVTVNQGKEILACLAIGTGAAALSIVIAPVAIEAAGAIGVAAGSGGVYFTIQALQPIAP